MNSLIVTAKRVFTDARATGISNETINGMIEIFEKKKALAAVAADKNAASTGLDVGSIRDIFTRKSKDSSTCTRSIDVQLTSSDKSALVNYAEFCHRVACLMSFGSSGPLALRYDVRKWSILRSPFVDKTSFKQYERRTYKRLVRVYNAHPSLHQNKCVAELKFIDDKRNPRHRFRLIFSILIAKFHNQLGLFVFNPVVEKLAQYDKMKEQRYDVGENQLLPKCPQKEPGIRGMSNKAEDVRVKLPIGTMSNKLPMARVRIFDVHDVDYFMRKLHPSLKN
ncbi:mitochondrial of 30S ribosomal protein S10 [Mitosporidium daphniae]|uniref:Mitochondrial of 30S ribosomal protein S10 n=1 Tax=Mitosporidium daphniae TaxID=1485682 RepID=A0A098VV91_9MICR|nr:mitochondrial of 30S ribosomal protein S10 [Mitosporidium daphniae]KGG51646.1 mitochondrial of 30S ribosomal protein S10 [Mitosporidium daphniae]|eukprot:XP_013238073.1 mitochondrial of 30S ribosomal protein S10 [Mitosporidium daphniae]